MCWIATRSCSRSGRMTTKGVARASGPDVEKRALERKVKQLETKVAARTEVRALERKLAALTVEHDFLRKAIGFNVERRR
jgi:hypothetical protein